jgi:ribosomal protein S6--L-glutamate ligase
MLRHDPINHTRSSAPAGVSKMTIGRRKRISPANPGGGVSTLALSGRAHQQVAVSPRFPREPAADRPLHVGVLVDGRYLAHREPAKTVDALRAAGHDVDVVVAERKAAALGAPVGVDVLLGRGRSAAFMSLLSAAEASGVPVVNPVSAIAAVSNKVGMGAALAAAGIPTPRTWVGPVEALAARSDLSFPLVLKPVYGDNARGLVVVHSRAELAGLWWPEPVALAQTYHRGTGLDLKLYVAGERVWVVRRPSPLDAAGHTRQVLTNGDPVPVTPTLAELARRCGEVFGLRLYGVDCVAGTSGPLVIEVNDYPTYRGAPGASEAIADVVTRISSSLVGAA